MDKKDIIKRAYSDSSYTVDTLKELDRCRTDPVYFIENYMFAQHPKKGLVRFKMYEFQKDMVRMMKENRFTISMVSRQSGKCLSWRTPINTYKKPSGFRKLILRFIDRETYDEIFKS